MKNVTFTEFRKKASSILTDVENGEVVVVLRHGKPIAEIIPDESLIFYLCRSNIIFIMVINEVIKDLDKRLDALRRFL